MFVPLARVLGFTVEEFAAASPADYAAACWNRDVVVLDATRERKGEHNYEVIMPTALDHVLAVSRNYLPLNFSVLRDSIFDPQSKTLLYAAPFYPGTQSNGKLIRWLELQLNDLKPRLPRPKDERGMFGATLRGGPRTYDLVDQMRHRDGQVFISYRSTDSDHVAALTRRIEAGEFHGGQPKAARYFPPALLSDELATEQRRWQILSMIDRFIGPADEVWVYESESYYDSWWTLGELATLAHRREVGYRGQPPPALKIFSPKEDRVRDAPENFLPQMTREQNKRMARWYANCDTASMGPEGVAAIRMMGQLPLVGLIGYFRDHVWSEEFWTHPLLDCGRCRVIGKRRNKFDVDALLWTRGPNFTRLTPEEMAEAVKAGRVVCRNCGAAYGIIADAPQHLWMPMINGHRTSEYWTAIFNVVPADPDDWSLVPLPTYRLTPPDERRPA
jgi:hypothetical protein